MEIIIRIYDRERLLEAKLQSGETCTIGKAAGCTIQLAAACLGKKTITVKTDADSWSVSGAGFRQEKLPYEKSLVLDPDAHLALTAYPCRTKAAVPVPQVLSTLVVGCPGELHVPESPGFYKEREYVLRGPDSVYPLA